MHNTVFSWELVLELLNGSTKLEGGRTPLNTRETVTGEK
jgi:hypothetical protein